MELVHVDVGSGQLLEWNEDSSGRLLLRVQHRPSKPSVVQKSQSQQTQSLWACTGLRAFDDDRLAIFCRRDSYDCNSKRPIAEDGGIEGDKDAGINETSANDKISDSASSCQNDSGTNELDSFGQDRSQDQSNTNSDGIGTQKVQDDHNRNGNDDRGDDSQDETANDAKDTKIKTLIEKIENSIKMSNGNLDERTWNQRLWEGIKLITSAQWHFDSLVDAKENDPVRKVIHKLSLHRSLEEKIKQGALHGCQHKTYTRQFKDDVMKVSLLCRTLDSTHQRSRRRQFDRYLQQGAVFDKLYSLCPGLMGLIAPTLTIPEIQTIDDHFDAISEAWKASDMCETASKCSAIVSAVLAAEPRGPQRQAKQRPKRMNETSTSDQRTSKRKRTCPDNGIVTPPSIPPTSAVTHTTSEETRNHPPEQSQQSSPSRIPSSQLLIQTNSLQSFDYSVSSGGCDGTNTNSITGMAMDGTAHQSSSNSVAAVQLFQNTPSTFMDQTVSTTAETFNCHGHAVMDDASMVLSPPSYIHQGNPSFGTLRQEQIVSTGLDPSSYVCQDQVENTGWDPSSYVCQDQVENTGWDPSSYVHQDQVENTGWDPSSYVHQERIGNTSLSSHIHQCNMSFSTPHDQPIRSNEIPQIDTSR